MGACVSSNSCRGRTSRTCSIDHLPTNTIQADDTQTNNNVSISSINASNSNNNNIASLHQIQTNSEQGSLSNLASIINNSISFNSSNSNSVLIANTLTNTTTSYYNNNNNNSFSNFVPPTGKNKKLKKDFIKFFKFDKKITESQLNAKREEFWDTAPAFEGKIEIWTALKAAVEAYEQKNYQLAQAIIDSANIILPRGFLNDCYDELGNRYQIPIYVLAKPINMRKSTTGSDEKDSAGVDDDSDNLKKALKRSKKKENNDLDLDEDEDDDDEDNDVFNMDDMNIQKTKSNFFRNKLRFSKCKNTNNVIGSSSFSNLDNKSSKSKEADEAHQFKRSNSNGETFQIKIRLSNAYNENDMKLTVTSVQTVAQLKAQVGELTRIEAQQQRLFFGGKLMKDKQKLRDHKLRKNVVVQVIVREAKVFKIDNNEMQDNEPQSIK